MACFNAEIKSMRRKKYPYSCQFINLTFQLCTLLAMTPHSSLISMFDFRTWTGYAIVSVFIVLALVIIIPICCCCYMYRQGQIKSILTNNDFRRGSDDRKRSRYGANTSTLPSTHHTMLSASSQPTHAEARVLLPTNGNGAQVEVRGQGCSSGSGISFGGGGATR